MHFKKIILTASILATSTIFGCIISLSSVNLCGTVFTFCSPADQLNIFYPYLEVPDYNVDPTCTIPYGCDNGFIGGLEGGPGGGVSTEPANSSDPVGGVTGGGGGI